MQALSGRSWVMESLPENSACVMVRTCGRAPIIWFCLAGMICTFGALAFWFSRKSFWQSLSSLNDDEIRGCGHDLLTSTDENPLAFADEHHSLKVSSMYFLINCAIEHMSREYVRTRLANASMNEFD